MDHPLFTIDYSLIALISPSQTFSMRVILFVISALLAGFSNAQQKAENLIIITTDGLRWQEVFGGMDTALARDPAFNEEDSAYIFQHYWHPDPTERRKKLMPFLWSVVEQQGRIYGNRRTGNNVNNANPYWFSYPGYSELLTGFVDTAINTNSYPENPNLTILEFLHKQPGFKGKVAAFGAWNAFDRILAQSRAGFPVISAFDTLAGKHLTSNQLLLHRMLRDSYRPWGDGECLDVFTHYAALEYLQQQHPRVLYIGYGETDEWAHAGKYRSYLDAAKQVDKWLQELWTFVQQDPQYKNKTAIFLTTDHGRGDIIKRQWTDHGSGVQDASEVWIAGWGKGITPGGEQRKRQQLFLQQMAATFAKVLGYEFKAPHPVSRAIDGLLN